MTTADAVALGARDVVATADSRLRGGTYTVAGSSSSDAQSVTVAASSAVTMPVVEGVHFTASRLHADVQDMGHAMATLRTEVEALRGQITDLRELVTSRPLVRPMTMADLGSDRYALALPMGILTEEYDDVVIARFPEVEAFAEGSTETEAVARLKAAIVSLFEDLRDTPSEQLGPLPRSWHRLLETFVIDRGSA